MLQLGSTGPAVRQLQSDLNGCGVQLDVDANFGADTDAAVRQFQADHGLEVDGKAGADTLTALACGADESCLCRPIPADLPGVLVARVARARSATGKGIRYKLGRGGKSGHAELPGLPGDPDADPAAGCDCSGFIAWDCGMARGPLPNPPPAWFETTQIHTDATGPQRMFRQIAAPVPGCLVTYPDANGHQGHIGLVTEVAPALRGIDCSSSRSKATGQAITERGFEFFRSEGAIFALLVTDPIVGN